MQEAIGWNVLLMAHEKSHIISFDAQRTAEGQLLQNPLHVCGPIENTWNSYW